MADRNIAILSVSAPAERAERGLRRITAAVSAFFLPGGRLTVQALAGATAAALVAVIALIMLGRVSYARGDFYLLPADARYPSIPSLQMPLNASGGAQSPAVVISGTSTGSPTAPITIVEYSDFYCGQCQEHALTTGKDLERVYVQSGKVRLVYKHLVIFSDKSMLAAQAAECAAEQNKFWPYYDLLMQVRAYPKSDDLSVTRLEGLASQAGLDMAAFRASLSSGKYKAKVAQDDAEGRMVGVIGTPTFFVNRMKGQGYKSFPAFEKVIEDLLKRSGS